jgi:hypothetical protein
MDSIPLVPQTANEPVLYAPDSPERALRERN